MAAATILMAILGCGDAGEACRQVAVAPARYESVSACVAAQDEVLARADIMYPVVSAECRSGGVAAARESEKPKAKPDLRAPMKVASRG